MPSLASTRPLYRRSPLRPSHRFGLTAIPFEFPIVPPSLTTLDARYVYGCTMSSGGFDARLGSGAKIDCLVKIDVRALIAAGLAAPPPGTVMNPEGNGWIGGVVDERDVNQILKERVMGVGKEWIKVFKFPTGVFGQEASFIPKAGKWRAEREGQEGGGEDEGWMCCYVFDEGRWLESNGKVKAGACSEREFSPLSYMCRVCTGG